MRFRLAPWFLCLIVAPSLFGAAGVRAEDGEGRDRARDGGKNDGGKSSGAKRDAAKRDAANSEGTRGEGATPARTREENADARDDGEDVRRAPAGARAKGTPEGEGEPARQGEEGRSGTEGAAEPPRAPVDTPSVAGAAPAMPVAAPAPTTSPATGEHRGGFAFGSYGRVLAASDATGRPARESDVVAHSSRLDLSNYVELELRREDHWDKVGIDTRIVSTLAIGNSIFHYDGVFDSQIAVRNLYLEASGLGAKGLSAWAGARMYRGDDIYLLNFWPLDNLNTIGAGVRYQAPTRTVAQLHMGFGQPQNPFYRQTAERPAPLNQFGAATVALLDRQRWVGSARLEQPFSLGEKAGMKLVGYAEAHRLPAGQRETARDGVYDDVPAENGFVLGAQVGAWTGERNTHLNLFVRYARGLAAYGDFAAPADLAADRTTMGAREMQLAVSGNWEAGPFALMAAGYVRSFRNASDGLDAGDVDEGIVIARPQVWFSEWLGLGAEASYQRQHRGVLVTPEDGGAPTPLVASMPRVGVMPFVTPAGRGSFSRPMLWLAYTVGLRDAGARALYPVDDPFRTRTVEHFLGVGAEWWFSSSSYGGQW